jgi:hypothetical protein
MRTEGLIMDLLQKGISYDKCQKLRITSFNLPKFACSDVCDDGITKADYVKIKKESVIRLRNEYEIKFEIFSKGPVYAEMKVYDDLFYYKSGIYYNTSKTFIGYHSVKVI